MLALFRKMSTQSASELLAALQSSKPEERFAAAYYVGQRKIAAPDELIALLSDPNEYVRQMARRSLILTSYYMYLLDSSPAKYGLRKKRWVDFGPVMGATKKRQELSVSKWQAFFEKNQESLDKLKEAQAKK